MDFRVNFAEKMCIASYENKFKCVFREKRIGENALAQSKLKFTHEGRF